MTTALDQEIRYRLLKYLADHPEATQREVARELGMSLGKVNYCLKALIAKGWIKARNFRNNKNKAAYLYILTRKGIEEKVDVTAAFLRRKVAEYDHLSKEIDSLTAEVRELQSAGDKNV
jgi:EPS-associated MarR family transcriptional regulator